MQKGQVHRGEFGGVLVLEQCPRHGGAFDCTPFCELCEGKQEYNPQELITCQVPKCKEQLTKEIYNEELGFCVECQHAWFDGKLDPYTLERVANA